MALTPEQIALLLRPKEVEYKSPAGHRRAENHSPLEMIQVIAMINGATNPGPTYRRVGHSRGFRARRGEK